MNCLNLTGNQITVRTALHFDYTACKEMFVLVDEGYDIVKESKVRFTRSGKFTNGWFKLPNA